MNILPEIKIFRFLFIGLLAVVLTGGIAVVNTAPASASAGSAISLTVFAAEAGLNKPAEGTPIYMRGTGLKPGSRMVLRVRVLNVFVGRSTLVGSFYKTVPASGNAFPTVAMPRLESHQQYDIDLQAPFDVDRHQGCEETESPVTRVEARLDTHLLIDSEGSVIYATVEKGQIECFYENGTRGDSLDADFGFTVPTDDKAADEAVANAFFGFSPDKR